MTATEPPRPGARSASFASRDQDVPGDPDFDVTFAVPADAELSWKRDEMHMPFALTPLAADFITDVIGAGLTGSYEFFGADYRVEGAIWHGYAYFAVRWLVAEDQREAAEKAFLDAARALVPAAEEYWNEALPRVREIFAKVAAVPVDDVAADDLAVAWDEAWAQAREAWLIHFHVVNTAYQALEDFIDGYEAAMGEGRSIEALELLGGHHHVLEEVEEGMEALEAAAGPPDGPLAQAVMRGAEGEPMAPIDLESFREHEGGDAFVDTLRGFLDQHGHLGQNHDDLRLASWAEAPRLLLQRIAARFGTSVEPARERESALPRRAEELTAQARAALAADPENLAAFETALAYGHAIGWLTEGHNYWIDRLSHARMRALAMRVGARLAREGVLPAADDVFFLHRGEIAAAIRDGQPRHALVADRAREHARNERRNAPYYVGVVPDQAPEGDRFSVARVTSDEPDELKGTGASAGVVRGPARVTLSQDDFGRIQPGDIVVCPSSNPSWVPVFTIAGGLVTNTGGILSHAAVVAREFGLPAVVGTGDATTKIADGRMVEIDGTAGTVRLL